MIPEYKRKSNIAAGVCLAGFVGTFASAYLGAASAPNPTTAVVLPVFLLVAGTSFIAACWYYIKAKARSGWWILVLLLQLIGLIVIAALKDYAKDPLPPGAV